MKLIYKSRVEHLNESRGASRIRGKLTNSWPDGTQTALGDNSSQHIASPLLFMSSVSFVTNSLGSMKGVESVFRFDATVGSHVLISLVLRCQGLGPGEAAGPE